jgi:hypothetical protein
LHDEHMPLSASHDGARPPQPAQPPHCPLLQTGLLLGQAAGVPPPWSPSQATQAPFMQTGNAPPQIAALTHGKQALPTVALGGVQ